MIKRTAIILKKGLTSGEYANISAIMMGQFGKIVPEVFAPMIQDANGQNHAAPVFSVVVLQANGEGQLINTAKKLSNEPANTHHCLFSHTGQSLNNEFESYKQRVEKSDTKDLGVVGLIVHGDDATVREVTKKFSLLK